MVRFVLWGFVFAMFLANGVFDIFTARVACRLADKLDAENRWGNPTYRWEPPTSFVGRGLSEFRFLPAIARRVFEARYALTALPLLFLLYFVWTRPRVDEAHLAAAMTLGTFALVLKVLLWETVVPLTDLCTAF